MLTILLQLRPGQTTQHTNSPRLRALDKATPEETSATAQSQRGSCHFFVLSDGSVLWFLCCQPPLRTSPKLPSAPPGPGRTPRHLTVDGRVVENAAAVSTADSADLSPLRRKRAPPLTRLAAHGSRRGRGSCRAWCKIE
jgi:hypothetical protein